MERVELQRLLIDGCFIYSLSGVARQIEKIDALKVTETVHAGIDLNQL